MLILEPWVSCFQSFLTSDPFLSCSFHWSEPEMSADPASAVLLWEMGSRGVSPYVLKTPWLPIGVLFWPPCHPAVTSLGDQHWRPKIVGENIIHSGKWYMLVLSVTRGGTRTRKLVWSIITPKELYFFLIDIIFILMEYSIIINTCLQCDIRVISISLSLKIIC